MSTVCAIDPPSHIQEKRTMSSAHGTESRKKRIYTPLSDIQNVEQSSSTNTRVADIIGPENEHCCPSPTIHNIVSTSKIVCISSSDNHRPPKSSSSVQPCVSYIDLDRIHRVVQCSHYNRKKFAAITIRIDDPTVTALLFTSGRLVITGSKSWYECMLASLVIVKMLKDVQPECHFYVQDCEIQNVVANVIIPGKLCILWDLDRIHIDGMHD